MPADFAPDDQELTRLTDSAIITAKCQAADADCADILDYIAVNYTRRDRLHDDGPIVPAPKQRREFDTVMSITSWERARPARHIPEGDDA